MPEIIRIKPNKNEILEVTVNNVTIRIEHSSASSGGKGMVISWPGNNIVGGILPATEEKEKVFLERT